MSESLEEIRKQIDSIDNQVHDLLMQRASLVSSVALAKKESGLQIVQPAREARMMRRLLSRHKGPLPKKTIIRIWRELVGSVSLLQTGLSVVIADESDGYAHWDMAKNYFGSAVPMQVVKGQQAVISQVLEDKSSFAVLPWPELDQEMPWWSHLFNRQNNDQRPLSIIGALPYEKTGQDDPSSIFDKALIISKMEFMPSDIDNSFIGLELSADISRARIRDKAEDAGLEVLNLFSGSLSHNTDVKVHLVQVKGFVDDKSAEVEGLRSSFDEECYYCHAMGGYPVIPDINENASVQDDAA